MRFSNEIGSVGRPISEKKAAKAAIALEKKAIAQRAKNEKAEAKAREAARKN